VKKKFAGLAGAERKGLTPRQSPELEAIGALNATLRIALIKAERFEFRHGYD
jgi:hypothetical protein